MQIFQKIHFYPPPLKKFWIRACVYIIYTKLNERPDCAVHVVTNEDGNVYLHKSTLEVIFFTVL